MRTATGNNAVYTVAVEWNNSATRGGIRALTGFLFGFPKALSLHFNHDGAHGPSRLSMSSYFSVVRQTWRACPSVFVGLCSLKSLGECLGVISASPPPFPPPSSLSLPGRLSASLGLGVYMDEGETWLKQAVELTPSPCGERGRLVRRGWTVRLYHESNEKGWEK